MIDVAIVGAGPAGLSLALALRAVAPHLKVKVFERSAALVPSGAAVTLFANGLNALEAISPAALEAVEAAGTPGAGMVAHNARTDDVEHVNPATEWKVSPDGPPLRSSLFIPWFRLQCALLCAWGGKQGEDLVLGKALQGIQQDDTGATMTFKDGSTAKACVVVGADGNMSAVRNALFSEMPEYIGTAFWRALLSPLPASWDLSQDHNKPGWLHNWVDKTTGKLMMIRVFDDQMSVSAASSWPEERLQELWRRSYYGEGSEDEIKRHHEAKQARFLEMFATEFPSYPISLLSSIDPTTIVEHGTFYRSPEQPWGEGCCTLLGDAAHVMPPNFGQGTSMAFEGAYTLATHLGRAAAAATEANPVGSAAYKEALQSELVAALRRYEEQHLHRVRPISDASIASARQFYQEKDGKTNPLASKNTEVLQFIFSAHQGGSPFKPLSSSSEGAHLLTPAGSRTTVSAGGSASAQRGTSACGSSPPRLLSSMGRRASSLQCLQRRRSSMQQSQTPPLLRTQLRGIGRAAPVAMNACSLVHWIV
mmetsp:Transcript_18421/g.48046  ORF Transcript_18421/g.48046 Transcript_18421/m.48046 type:complete len:536 (-) Transcript_18421:351-1958(-)